MCAPTRGRVAEMDSPEEASILTVWKPGMKTSLSFGYILFTITEQDRCALSITCSFFDPLDRQLQERVNITNFKGAILMNRRNEMGGVRVERTRHRRWAPLARV